ncbi:MAG: aminopeptidase P N-terminal domain-containing protein [Gammaproteobacteria bacterium]|nr:aminopeptidase P N-terminal domain-containing protein [Gammaproteobacteria bacterium]MCZ6880670.1 aminopeptidase P N-terminal domain-containing protein [Gammaproteobacteria bacterium]
MTPTEFARRRRQLMRMIGSGGIAILPAAPEKIRNRDTIYPFRQDSDFIYLSGFDEPDAVAVLIPGRAHAEYILFCRERDPSRETWDGPRAGPEGAQADHGADDAFPISDIDEILPGLMEHCDRVYYTMGAHPDFDTQVMGWFDGLRNRGQGDGLMPQEFIALDHLLHDMRLYKSRGEIGAMRKAARIAAAAHKKLMAACRPGIMEYELEAELLHEFKRNGCETAYQPIVGSGPNSCVLHYVKNDRRMEDGEMLLVDAGCEYRGYASDVTRSMPVNGRFSSEQKAIYQIVLDAQKAAIEKVSPRCHWNEPHDAAVRTITRGLVKLGLLKGRVPALIKATAYKKFFMHRTGHWLGMDVHDVGDYRVGDEWRHLEPGMVMTVEPGIYIPPGIKGVAKKWWGIGVRIEDDVLVTKDGCEVLSRDVPREIADIEALMNGEI